MNLRQKDRISVNLPCRFQKSDLQFTGRVKNMSRVGLLTVWNRIGSEAIEVTPGDVWQVEIELPVHHLFPPNAFYCEAVVVRTGRGSRNSLEVAFRIDSMMAADLRSRAAQPVSASQLVM